MSSLSDYLAKPGLSEISRKTPLNILDALALARFSYLPFDKINLDPVETISSLARKMQILKLNVFLYPEDKQMIKLLGKNPRFYNLKVTDFVYRLDKKTVEQFAAITIHLPDSKLYISFIGTDDTLNGWREDCNMAVQNTVPSQKSAKRYLKNIATKYPDEKIYLGGHSKGGTLAMYAALTTKPDIVHRVKYIYSFDGPGLSEKLTQKALRKFEAAGEASPLSRMTNYIPQDSIVGRLFSHAEKFEVVKSNAKNFYQHNVHSWQVNQREQKLVPAKISKKSDFVDRAVSSWISSMPKKQRKMLIDSIFKILESSKYNSPIGISADGIRSLPDLVSSYRKLDKSEQRTILQSAKKLLKLAIFKHQ